MIAKSQIRRQHRGKTLVIVLVSLPGVFGILGLVFDAGLMMSVSRQAQNAADAAATAAAMSFSLTGNTNVAQQTATEYVQDFNAMPNATVETHIPPTSGLFSGRDEFIEVLVSRQSRSFFVHLLGNSTPLVTRRAVAGVKAATDDCVIVVLDPKPAPLSIPPIPPILPPYPQVLGGLEVLGVGELHVDGAVLVNTTFGGVDENGDPAGDSAGPPYGISCTPILALTKLLARNIRVAGGVDNPQNYGSFDPADDLDLDANRLPVPDPLEDLPVPSLATDPANVVNINHGGVTITEDPLNPIPTILTPGVYDWIEVISGTAIFEPGIYIVRDVNPTTEIAVNAAAGEIIADGVMFYITNNASFSADNGMPDAAADPDIPPPNIVGSAKPSIVIAPQNTSQFTPLDDPSSPFDGILFFQHRSDRRPMILTNQNLLGPMSIEGAIYSKWGHVGVVGDGTWKSTFVAGTMRVIVVSSVTFEPDELLPPARDVFLVE